MPATSLAPSRHFSALVEQIGEIGRQRHRKDLLRNAAGNVPRIKKSLRDLRRTSDNKGFTGIVVSAGPSLHRRNSIQRIVDAGYRGTVIAVDAAYIACLKRGLIPDYVVTLDPHPTRMVRWFGDHDWDEHNRRDGYFERQDLNVEFRENSIRQNRENIELVNRHGHLSRAVVASSAPANVIERLAEARMEMFGWNPLVDEPRQLGSITRQLYGINKWPCMNTGGNVGGAAWVFANTILALNKVALAGMDFGYYGDLPIEKTQTYHELIAHLGTREGIEKYFCDFIFPLTGERFYTDTTYYWYRRNFLQLLDKARGGQVCNCTEGGTLFGDRIPCVSLDDFIRESMVK